VPSGALPTTHILKPAVSGFDDQELNEHLCLDAARRAGLIAARTYVGQFGDESAIVVERYDRLELRDEIVRIHQEDFCQALGVLPSLKYQNEGGPGPVEIVSLLRRVMTAREAESSVWRFIDALIWNWVIGGTDAHAKNYSVLLSGDQVRLAPLYDITSALPYDHEKRLRLAMRIGGEYDVYPYRNTWPKAAHELGVDPDALLDRVRDLAARAGDSFSEAASDAAILALGRELPDRLTGLIADRASRCLALLDSRDMAVTSRR
jgi:serine/threonine-protein kinase HipA